MFRAFLWLTPLVGSNAVANPAAPIPMDQLGAAATQQVEGDGMSVVATPDGARLRCAFQKLEGHATPEGLWLTSTAEDAKGERFRLVATRVGRTVELGLRWQSGAATPLSDLVDLTEAKAVCALTPRPPHSKTQSECASLLETTGQITVTEQLVRFIRPRLTEEYSVSVDGVRQDFIVHERPPLAPAGGEGQGEGALREELALNGAQAEATPYGAKLTLDGSGRTIAYTRLRVTDATDRELPARLEVFSNGESQRDSNPSAQGWRDAPTLGNQPVHSSTLKGLHHRPHASEPQNDSTPLRLNNNWDETLPARLEVLPVGDEVTRLKAQAGGASVPASRLVSNLAPPDSVHATTLAVLVDDTHATYPIRIDPTFSDADWVSLNPEGLPGANLWINAVVSDDSGNVYVGGAFTFIGTVAANRVAKWDGSSWSALGSGLGGEVEALAVSGTNLYAGGNFTTAGGVSATNIAKWDGSSWSALGSGVGGTVLALAVSGSNVYVGGTFGMAGPSPIAKWDGATWSSLGSWLNGPVGALAIIATNLYAGGSFTTADGVTVNRIARWDGSSWSALGSGMNDGVLALAVSGTSLYAGGSFSMAGSLTNANGIAVWDGSAWSAVGTGMSGGVSSLAMDGTELYAGGFLSVVGASNNINYVVKWDGSNWSSLGWGTDDPWSSQAEIDALAVSGTDLFVGGDFMFANGVPANHIATWDGNTWSALGSGMNDFVVALLANGSDVYVGGKFTAVGGVLANRIAKWDGSEWSALGSGMNDFVLALTMSGTNLYAAGRFTIAGGVAANRVARWDGVAWSPLGSGIDGLDVYAMAVKGSDLYAGGYFDEAGGVSVQHIAKWDGNTWSALGSGMDSTVSALAILGTDLYAGGLFTKAGGVTVNYIAKWNGSVWSPLGSGMNDFVREVATDGTYLYVGGDFTNASGIPANYIARWDGSSWAALGSGMGGVSFPVVEALAISGTNLYAAGWFHTAGGWSATNIAKWDGSAWSALGSGAHGEVRDLAADLAGHLFVGGHFHFVGTTLSPFIAQANLIPTIAGGRFHDWMFSPLGGFSVTFTDATIGEPYRIQSAPVPGAGGWSDVTNFNYTEPTVISDPTAGPTSNRVFRAVTP